MNISLKFVETILRCVMWADTQRNNNVIMMSKRRRNIVLA